MNMLLKTFYLMANATVNLAELCKGVQNHAVPLIIAIVPCRFRPTKNVTERRELILNIDGALIN